MELKKCAKEVIGALIKLKLIYINRKKKNVNKNKDESTLRSKINSFKIARK